MQVTAADYPPMAWPRGTHPSNPPTPLHTFSWTLKSRSWWGSSWEVKMQFRKNSKNSWNVISYVPVSHREWYLGVSTAAHLRQSVYLDCEGNSRSNFEYSPGSIWNQHGRTDKYQLLFLLAWIFVESFVCLRRGGQELVGAGCFYHRSQEV